MRLVISIFLGGLVLGGLATGIIAFQMTPTPPITTPPVATPQLEATVEARVADILRLRETTTPIPTPVAVDRTTLTTFARAYLSLAKDWDAFDREFNALRQEDISQGKEKAAQGLQGLLTTLQSLATDIRALPRTSDLWLSWSSLVQAVEREEAALRKLQQTWKPGDEKAFDDFDKERQAADKQRREAERELTRRATPPSAEVLTFAQGYAPLEKRWDEFHASYTAQRLRDNPSDVETTKALGQLVSRFRSLSAEVKALSRPTSLREPWSSLVKALEREELALAKLQETWKKDGAEAFASYEKERDAAEKLRQQAEGTISEQATAPSAEVLAFNKAYSPLTQRWDSFHSSYATWRLDYGRSTSVGPRLSQLAADLQKLLDQVKALPRPQPLAPLAESLARAADREHKGLLRLREAWRPLEPAPYDIFEQQREAAQELRRQAEASLEGLLRQQGLSLKALSP